MPMVIDTQIQTNTMFYARMQVLVLLCCVLHDISSRHYFAPLASLPALDQVPTYRHYCMPNHYPSVCRRTARSEEKISSIIMDLPSISFVGLGNGGGGAWGVGGICCAVGRRI